MEASGSTLRAVGWTTIASGLLAAVGVVFLTFMFAAFAVGSTSAGRAFGRINDILILVAYLLTVPSVLAVRAIARPRAPVPADLAAILGLVAIGGIVVLQAMLVAEVLTFEQQVGPVSVALIALGVWFIVAGRMATLAGFAPHGARMGLVAATYVGYPIWAIWIGRRFLGRSAGRHARCGLLPDRPDADEPSW
jgi:hypothetical protein